MIKGDRSNIYTTYTPYMRQLSLPSLRGRYIEYPKAGCVHLCRVAAVWSHMASDTP